MNQSKKGPLTRRRHIICSWHQKTKPRILQFTNLKCCIKTRETFKTPFYFLFTTFKNISSMLFHLKDILQHYKLVNWWIGEFVVSFFWCKEQVSIWSFSDSCLNRKTTVWMIMLGFYSEGISGHFLGLFQWHKHSWTHVHSPKEIIYLEKINMGICIHRCNSLCIFSIEASHNL